jgi:hypothetical protein
MSGARSPRVLPGFRFETKAPPLAESLPRMDVAVFVGFAASGPLQTPVALESEAQFASLFGHDAPLAWDLERGEQIYAYLAPAVRAFFRNGGQRCWVIRVARRDVEELEGLNRARYNYFPITGLARAVFGDDGGIALAPAFTRARSEGSWSDSLSVSSALLSRPEQARRGLELVNGNYVLNVARPTADEFANGDLLRLTFSGNRYLLFLTVGKIESVADSPPASPAQRTLRLTGSKPLWFEVISAGSLAPPNTPAQVHVFTHEGNTGGSLEESRFETVYAAIFRHDEENQPPTFELTACPAADAPPPGAVIRIDIAGQQLWMTVDSQDFKATDATTTVSGQPVRWLETAPALPASTPSCERVTFELWVRKAGEYSVSLSDLGFEARHGRFWGTLPTDETLYQDVLDDVGKDLPATLLWRQVGDLFRFPLAGPNPANDVYFPLAMAAVADVFLGPVRIQGSQLQRDGLAQFDSRLFIDRDLTSVPTEALASQAELLMYLSPNPRRLTGMHAAWSLEEATIIAIPDAVHRGWVSHDEEQPPPPAEPDALPPPAWWHLVDCRPQPPAATRVLRDCDQLDREETTTSQVRLAPADGRFKFEPPLGNFLNCAISDVPAPPLTASPDVSPSGTFTLSWDSSLLTGTAYILQEATIADFNDAETVYSGSSTSFTFYGRKTGVYFYRVQARVGQNVSDWSRGVTVSVTSQARWALKPEAQFVPDTLLAVQRAMLRLGAARGDLFCVLSLPVEYREDKAIEHVTTLKEWLNVGTTQGVEPLGATEANDFSYGAVYHPWLINGEGANTDSLRRIPPCGAISGVFAHRALTRGAWIAPANEPMRGVVALVPPIGRERRLEIQNASINLVRQEPRGFIVLDSDTLSDDPDFRPINVRRLLILLRRQALRLGATYVFEPHSPAFRRLVERGFTGMLDGMFVRGAFAGSSPATAYQVVADESLNTSQSVDQGRFMVELRVAPSLPLTFLTIRFIQTGDRSFVTEVR